MSDQFGEEEKDWIMAEHERVFPACARSVAALNAYTGNFEDDWAAFAKAEGGEEDPIQAALR